MLSIAHNIDIYKKCIGLQKSKPVIMNCIATAFKIPWIKRELFYMLKTFKKEIESFAKVDTWSFPKWLDYLHILHT